MEHVFILGLPVNTFFQILNCVYDVAIFLVFTYLAFALNDPFSLKAKLFQAGKQSRKVDLTLTYRNLSSQLLTVRRIKAILYMNVPDIWPDHVKCVNRVPFPVEDQVRGFILTNSSTIFIDPINAVPAAWHVPEQHIFAVFLP